MLLTNVQLLNSDVVSIQITGKKIISITKNAKESSDPLQLDLDRAIALPGLINSHDHLDFNLFPMLGNGTYNNYTEWGNSIHINYKKEINEVLKIPEPLRVAWGIYKNLLCGVTTVINHGKHLQIDNPLINVIQPDQSLHSVKFEKFWKLKLNNPFKKNTPCVIHTGEGTDKKSKLEIDELIKWNLLKRNLIAIHGVAMTEQQANNFKALVWCPASNYFLLKKTAQISILKNQTKICFGTDSTLTSDWNIWSHLRMARETKWVSDNELYEMLTVTPAKIWNLQCGTIEEQKDADIVIVKATTPDLSKNFYALNPEDILMIIHGGQSRLFDEQLFQQIPQELRNDFYKIKINNSGKYMQGNVAELIAGIKSYYPKAVFPIAVE